MKRQALDHTKMDLLMRKLKIRRFMAVGILESLWHLTAREAPRGDIGRLSDERIAIGIDWGGDAHRLVSALIDAGWIDQIGDDPPAGQRRSVTPIDASPIVNDADRCQSAGHQRLLIHDWPDHCDEAVKKYLKRNGLCFACRDMSRHVLDMSRLPEDLKTGRPVPEDQTPAPTSPPTPFPRQSDYPLTDAAIRGRCPTADLPIVVRITEAAVREYLSVDAPKINPPDDAMIAAAVEEAARQSPKQAGPGLFLRTVPSVIKTWAQLGRHPPPSQPRSDPIVEAAKRDWEQRQKDLRR